ncbi:MAG: tRNA uridine-5-carboxymethylaminomethyl(34) synthesis GTPase MnmE [Paludibacteraceae bacterium]|nr:tRNA uridine-5-carboxymethylaminomethyl(34) synthesis GTPase MnmE [Paludibacteraceae bacterium]
MQTICAISTPYGVGGFAVIRVSGDDAIAIVDRIFSGRVALSETPANVVRHGRIQKSIIDNRKSKIEILDEVLCSVFRAPHSFTGEDTVEIACHGSIYIQQELVRWLIDAGCRAAEPGEFTRRAFLNGKMDLTQAESVADLIAAQSKAEKDLALSQLRGSVSNELASLRERLLHFTSLVELELDFADHEELEFADRGELTALADEIEKKLAALIASFRTGNAIRNGIPVAIVGAPNVGKSTLLNALLGEQRAIVSDIQGTTRDTIEDTLIIDGILFRLIDTAGLRETDDTIENMGIERSRKAIERAQIVVHVKEPNPDPSPKGRELIEIKETVIEVVNKCDLIKGVSPQGETNGSKPLLISAKNNDIEPLKQELVRIAKASMSTSAVMLSNARHYEAVVRAHSAIARVQEGLVAGLSGELLSLDLQDCLNALGEVTGQITNQEVLANIFSKFCIGK